MNRKNVITAAVSPFVKPPFHCQERLIPASDVVSADVLGYPDSPSQATGHALKQANSEKIITAAVNPSRYHRSAGAGAAISGLAACCALLGHAPSVIVLAVSMVALIVGWLAIRKNGTVFGAVFLGALATMVLWVLWLAISG
jgi:hypothetical protein